MPKGNMTTSSADLAAVIQTYNSGEVSEIKETTTSLVLIEQGGKNCHIAQGRKIPLGSNGLQGLARSSLALFIESLVSS